MTTKPKKDLPRILSDLSFALTRADRLLVRAGEDEKKQRKAVLEALTAVEAFIAAALDHRGGFCIAQLRRRLENVGNHAGLEFKRPRGRPPETRTENASQGVVAAAMHGAMYAYHLGEAEAAKRVSGNLAKVGIKIDHKLIMAWRDKFMRGHRGPGSDFYEKMIVVGDDEDSPQEQADNLIRAAIPMIDPKRVY
jgi:hypothetical protein